MNETARLDSIIYFIETNRNSVRYVNFHRFMLTIVLETNTKLFDTSKLSNEACGIIIRKLNKNIGKGEFR